MSLFSRLAVAGSLAALCLVSPAGAGSFNDAQKSEVETLVRDYLLTHPEILREMAERLELKDKKAEEDQRAKALVDNKNAVFKSPLDPVVGNAKGDVTVVEFMDYNCGWCKKAVNELSAVVETDKNLRVVFKEFPIFGEGSEYAARAAIAAGKQGKYWELHRALFAHEGQVTKDVVDGLAAQIGLDAARLKTDIESTEIAGQIAANMELGKSLAISGTPAFIVDGTVYGGYLPKDSLMGAIAEVRANGCKMC